MIKHVFHKDIDITKWDKCVEDSDNCLIYAKSFYLNNISPNWNALVYKDYEAVMPLPWRSKFCIKYLYQPAFFQQGGVFGKNFSSILVLEFIKAIPNSYKLIDITLNYHSYVSNEDLTKKNNFILELNEQSPTGILTNKGFREAYNKALKQNFSYKEFTEIELALSMHKSIYGNRISVNEEEYKGFLEICNTCKQQGNMVCRIVEENGNLVSLVLLLKDKNRLYNIISCTTLEGRKKNSNYFLYYKLIEEFAQSGLILDLEGSDIPGVEFFYKRITDKNQPYFYLRKKNYNYKRTNQ